MDDPDVFPCPRCGKEIYHAQTYCPHCSLELYPQDDDPAPPAPAAPRRRQVPWWMSCGLIALGAPVVLITFLLLVLRMKLSVWFLITLDGIITVVVGLVVMIRYHFLRARAAAEENSLYLDLLQRVHFNQDRAQYLLTEEAAQAPDASRRRLLQRVIAKLDGEE
jgi:hypothetical protein